MEIALFAISHVGLSPLMTVTSHGFSLSLIVHARIPVTLTKVNFRVYYLLFALSNGIPSALGALDFFEVNTSAIMVAKYGSIL